jgi:uncharacterized cupin superfamily protein
VGDGAARVSVVDLDADEGWEPDAETGGLVRVVRASDALTVGLWKPSGTGGSPIEYRLEDDETLVVLRGTGDVRVDGGEPIELRPGVVVSLSRGCELSWRVDDEFRELWVYS